MATNLGMNIPIHCYHQKVPCHDMINNKLTDLLKINLLIFLYVCS